MELRDYQIRVINDLYNAFYSGYKKIVLTAGCGAGKTIVSTKITQDAVANGSKMFFVVHLDALVGQTYEKFYAAGLDVGFIKAGFEEVPEAPIQICSIQTMASRDWWKTHPADLIIFDEGHITALSQVGQELMYETHPNAYFIALTATPKRLGGEQLGDHFDAMVSSPVPSELQKMGFLAPMRYFVSAPESQPDLSTVGMQGDDYEPMALKNACYKPELIASIVKEWFLLKDELTGEYLCRGKRTLAFCTDIDHAKALVRQFDRFGVPSVCVTSETPIKVRKQFYKDLRSGKLLVISSVGVISIGFDEPAAEVGLMLRPTQSEALHIQQLGRIMRPSKGTGKEFGVILDQAGNTTRLGTPEDITEYELLTSKEKGTKPAPLKECPQCGTYTYTFAVDCGTCDHHWLTKQEVNTNDLIELPTGEVYSSEQLRKELKIYRLEAYRDKVSPREAEVKFAQNFGVSPLDSWYHNAILSGNKNLEEDFVRYLVEIAKKENKDEDWMYSEYCLEMGVAA